MDKQHADVVRSWAKFLHPRTLKGNLIVSSLFLAAFELLMSSIVHQLKDWHSIGFREDPSQPYKDSVLSLHNKKVQASLLWFTERGVIDDDDIALVHRILDHRNELAHELMRFLSTADSDVDLDLLRSISYLISKIDRWWIREIEVPCNEAFDDTDVDAIPDNEIQSGNMICLQMMINIATGDESDTISQYNSVMASAETQMQRATNSA